MSDSKKTFQTTSQAIFKSSAPPILVGGEGNILPCVELCNINFNFQQQDKFTVSNQNGRLYIETDEGLSSKSSMFPCFQSVDICSVANTPSDKLYTLEDIIITSPSLHRLYVNEKATIFDGEIYIVFKNTYEGETTYKVLSVLLTQTSTMSLATANNCLNAYKLFESLANDLPEKDSETTVSTIADWDINDLLPANKWFYNYTHPNNTSVNWYVYKNPLYIPSTFKTNFISTVSQITSNGKIETGTVAYNTLYSTIQTLQNPITTDNSFVIFEQRDLTVLAGGSGTAIPTTSQTVDENKNVKEATSNSVYENSEDEEVVELSKSGTKYETGTTKDLSDEEEEEELEEQIYEENKTWAIIVLLINLIYFVGAFILIYLVASKNNKLINILNLKDGKFNWIFYLLMLIVPFIIITGIYLGFGMGSSDVATANTVFMVLNYIVYVALFIYTAIQSKNLINGNLNSSVGEEVINGSKKTDLPEPVGSEPLTPNDIKIGLLDPKTKNGRKRNNGGTNNGAQPTNNGLQ